MGLVEVYQHSLDVPINSHGDDSQIFADLLEDPAATQDITAVENRLLLKQIWQTAFGLWKRQLLSHTEWEIFVRRYYDGMTQDEIAEVLENEKSQSGVNYIEHRVLEKIRREIETPGANDKKADAEFMVVESAVDLLRVLDIPIEKQTDILTTARNILDNLPVTAWQREVMHALMGTRGKHFRPKEFARLKGRTHRAIYAARENAMANIKKAWATMPAQDRLAAANKGPYIPVTLASRGPRPNTNSLALDFTKLQKRRLDKGRLLEIALELKPKGRLTRQEVASLAAAGLFVDIQTIEAEFRSWGEFQSLCAQLRRQLQH